MARLPYISREDLTEDKTHIYDRIAETRKGDIQAKGMPRIFQLLLNNPEAAAPVAALGEYIRFSSNLDPVVREIAILSTAREMSSQYEWAHHEPIARQVGVRDQVIESIRVKKAPMGLPPKEGVFVQLAKEMANNGDVNQNTFNAVEHLLGANNTVDLLVLVAYYAMLSKLMHALDIELEPGIEPGFANS